MMEVMESIKKRRSVRRFTERNVEEDKLKEILEAGRWAPSGLNNQPWRFRILREEKERIAGLTRYSAVIKGCDVCIAVWMDNDAAYDRTKDAQSVGACIQNMLLAAASQGLGSCWLGEILNRKEEVNDALGIESRYELMAVIALGYAAEEGSSRREELSGLSI